MKLPPDVTETEFSAALEKFRSILGADRVYSTEQDVELYRDAYSPLWGENDELVASAAVAPTTVEEVQAIVRVANEFRIPLFPISTGKNLGYGGSAPNLSGSVIVDLCKMNKIVEVDDRRNYCIVEPGVSYFDLYDHITKNDLKLIVDVPDPGWGSLVGNALDHGVGYMMGMYRDHWNAHCFMEVVLPNGEIMRTGMGAAKGIETWGEYRYGFGPIVDGLFSQGNFGIVTKMGFWMMPRPAHFLSAIVSVQKYEDIIPLVDEANYLEDCGIIGHPRYGSPLQPGPNGVDAELLRLHALPGGGSVPEYQKYVSDRGLEYWNLTLFFYGPKAGVEANYEFAKERFSRIPGVTFKQTESLPFPLSAEDQEKAKWVVSLGIPTMERFALGIRSDLMPKPSDGHIWFSPVIPRSGEGIIKAHQVFGQAFKEMGVPSPIGPFTTPRTWIYRAFVFVMSFSVYRTDPAANRQSVDTFRKLIDIAADHGWNEYRTAPPFQDQVAKTYSFNDNALLRFQELLKDAADPNGIIAPGRGGVWPKRLRNV
ncbi:FAD-binding oxidoreductase (plasmid) [Agrobacterium radiobacter]|uniref:Putative p-cresol methylhydroxylase subunit n=1 Tax=Agrobacterium tumefaciens str. B6 TaxID=1183423 RepID=A0A822VF27_AGRTU|nr:FAD-binding oxidoreductase [Agrobacterium tumefaciens]MQB27889.1 FAD-binding oxidoreductase [Agrobacterium tumefaciens]NTA08336.1 FAD-binding oxidoreductase [Agrobacterium tumefaciens]NTB16158.1 FAD-binding oxidoreductase [Agrobacterium tumefaciens]CVI25386.1 putative p-cresol methylhydroxylase subunit [Agrobacterium tumefaciens str. B6]SPZ33097.1 putative D-lactate ferricytochrome C oxidoreductase [Agrobacterium tumefaciens]